uniref:HDC13913 n=1 Tax=Drosophila melanogaster TaxID=7227 RepID=Q6IJZ6_DROME|nr:TPA_inf: HDC13913 [Drosophila melanogaster]
MSERRLAFKTTTAMIRMSQPKRNGNECGAKPIIPRRELLAVAKEDVVWFLVWLVRSQKGEPSGVRTASMSRLAPAPIPKITPKIQLQTRTRTVQRRGMKCDDETCGSGKGKPRGRQAKQGKPGQSTGTGTEARAGERGIGRAGGRKMRNTCDSATTATDLDDDNTQRAQHSGLKTKRKLTL